jgi:hypothetical protein
LSPDREPAAIDPASTAAVTAHRTIAARQPGVVRVSALTIFVPATSFPSVRPQRATETIS